jgi:hypothetical protein
VSIVANRARLQAAIDAAILSVTSIPLSIVPVIISYLPRPVWLVFALGGSTIQVTGFGDIMEGM